MKFKMFGLVVAAGFLLSACGEEFEDNRKSGSSGDSTVSISSLDTSIKAEVLPSEEPERYNVYFSWPKLAEPNLIRVRLDRTLAVVSPDQTHFTHRVAHNQLLTYSIDVLDEASKVIRSFPKKVSIPKDLVVREGTSELINDQKISVSRLFLKNDFPLRTNGYRIEIEAQEIHGENGVVETFSEEQKAQVDKPGRSGGSLKIKAARGIGNMRIVMRGEHGGDGSKGDPIETRGTEGAGRNPFPQYPCGSSAREGLPDWPCGCWLAGPGLQGESGSPGQKGTNGKPAQDGGGSGNLEIEITDGREFALLTDYRVGSPGTPGEGGDGQLGGLGGAGMWAGPSQPGLPLFCFGRRGDEGAQGPSGDKGDPAKSGERGRICVYIPSEKKNDCY